MASSSSSRSSASFSCGSCWVPVAAGTGRLYQRAGRLCSVREGVPSGGGRLRPPTRAPAEGDVENDAEGEDGDADQLAGGEVPPGAAGQRAEEVEHTPALLVPAHRFDERAQRRVEDQVEREQLAVEALARAPQRERHEDAQLAERLVELRGMYGQRARRAELDDVVRQLALVGERLGREARRPGQVRIARRSPAAARGEASQPADGVADG